MKKYVFYLFLFLPFVSNSQEYVDLFSANYRKSEETSFDNLSENTTVTKFETNITIPIVLNEKYVVITGANFGYNALQLFPDSNYNHLYSTLIKAGLKINHSEHWSGTYVLLPKLASDYVNLSNEDFYLGGAFLLKYKKNKGLNYSLGFYGSTEAFGLFVTPIMGLYYVNSRFEIKLSLPIDADINYRLSNKTRIGFDYVGLGSGYKLTNENIRSYYVQNNSLEISSYLQQNLFHKNVLLRLKIGVSNNGYKVYPIDQKIDLAVSAFKFGDKRTQLNSDLVSSVFFKIESIYRFDISSDKK